MELDDIERVLTVGSHRLGSVNETHGAFGASQPRVSTAPGRFICFEGGDGAGKSTQVELLTAELTRRGDDVLVTRQPGGTPLGAQIRELVLHGDHVAPRAEALLFAADKAHHVEELIRPALAAGRVVITDRYTDSSIAYQGAGRHLGADEIRELQHWAVGGLFPDLTIILDVTPEVGRARRGDLHDRLEAEADDFHWAWSVMSNGVWRDLVGQEPTIETLSRAVADPAAMTHAWLFTGPPGSGRSTAARAFAAALQCPTGGCGECIECRTALDGSHADVDVVSTEGLSIKVEKARQLVQLAAMRPSVGRYRIIIIEDADRLTAYTDAPANALLKALEEPTPRTVWMLCAPSLEDVIVTIRSRSRHVRLRTPPVEAVADLLQRRDGIEAPMALYAARAAQSHIGLARRLARDDDARIRRHDVISMATRIVGVGDAIGAAADLAQISDEESKASAGERDAAERARLLETLGADPAARTQPPHIRSQVAALEKEQKTRATRHARDVIDRSLVDLTSVYRDALVLRLRSDVDLVNPDALDKVRALANVFSAEQLLGAMDAINEARDRINANVTPLLALEAMALQLRVPRDLGV